MSARDRTPGPYRIAPMASGYVLADDANGAPVIVAKATHPVDARFIARSCNSHDDLVKALADALKASDTHLPAVGDDDWLPNARMVLAKAVLL